EVRSVVVIPRLEIKSERRLSGLDVLLAGDLPGCEHGSEDEVAARLRPIRPQNGRIPRRRARDASEQGGFRQRQLVQVLAEIELGSRFEAEVSVAERNDIDIHGEDWRFGEIAVDLHGDEQSMEFPSAAFF